MGTHPIFESDFDCLTDLEWLRKYTEPTTPLCASTWPPTDRTTCPRTPDSSTPTICENAGSTTPTSTDAPMSEYLGKDTEVCGYFRNNFLQICPATFVKEWDEQRANKLFTSPVYSRNIKDSTEWEPKHEAWKTQSEAAQKREAEYREFFAAQKSE